MAVKDDHSDDVMKLVKNLLEGWKAVDPNLVIDDLTLEEMEDPFAETEDLLAEMEKVTGQFRESYAELMDDVDELLNTQRNKFLQ